MKGITKRMREVADQNNQVVDRVERNGFWSTRDRYAISGERGNWVVRNETRNMDVSGSFDTREDAREYLRKLQQAA